MILLLLFAKVNFESRVPDLYSTFVKKKVHKNTPMKKHEGECQGIGLVHHSLAQGRFRLEITVYDIRKKCLQEEYGPRQKCVNIDRTRFPLYVA